MPEPGPIRFPAAKPSAPVSLSLPRRPAAAASPFAVSEASAAARESIKAIVSATRAPFATGAASESRRIAELERSLRLLEASLAERERVAAENESRLAERERDLAEAEALLIARERLARAERKPVPAQAAVAMTGSTATTLARCTVPSVHWT